MLLWRVAKQETPMKRILIASALALAAAAPAFAADLPPPGGPPPRAPVAYVPAPPPFSWTGFYVGVNGGWGFANGNTNASIAGGPLTGATGSGSGSLNGGIAGGQIGFNYQMNALVVGFEGDIDWSGQSRTDTFGCGVGCTVSETVKIPWLATARVRIGGAFDHALVYATGGAAWTNASDSLTASALGVTANLLSLSSTNTGWTAGGGVEYAFTDNWTARIEYLYVQTNLTASAAVPFAGGTITETAHLKDNLVRGGINYKFSF
jgi:outer membrane immunogenic protein